MRSDYNNCLQAGQEFEDFAAHVLKEEFSMPVYVNRSRAYQTKHGETHGNLVELKLDRMFRSTGNYYIEVRERSDCDMPWHDAGIYSDPQPAFVCIGDMKGFDVFATAHLVAAHKKGSYRFVSNATNSAEGFLLPVRIAADIRALHWPRDAQIDMFGEAP